MITNQLKENIIKGWLFMLSGPSFTPAFVFSINSLILSVFLLTSFHLAEASLSPFSWLYTLVCAVVQKYHEMSFIYIIHIFITHFTINLFYLHDLKRKQPHRACKRTKSKQKQNHVMLHSNWHMGSIARFSPQTMQRMASLSDVRVKRKISCQ